MKKHIIINRLISRGKSIKEEIIKIEPFLIIGEKIKEENIQLTAEEKLEEKIVEEKENIQLIVEEKIEEKIVEEPTFTFTDIYDNCHVDEPVSHDEVKVLIKQKSIRMCDVVNAVISLRKFQKEDAQINGWKI
jgi:hypothetical protein